MIVGADATDRRAGPRAPAPTLYGSYSLTRVYYSAFSPIPACERDPAAESRRPCSARTGSTRPTGCCASTASRVAEIAGRRRTGMLDLEIDPKLAWALEEPGRASRSTSTPRDRELLLRVPGLGVRAVDRIPGGRAPLHERSRRADITRSSHRRQTRCAFPRSAGPSSAPAHATAADLRSLIAAACRAARPCSR